jgi:hypothetical protein
LTIVATSEEERDNTSLYIPNISKIAIVLSSTFGVNLFCQNLFHMFFVCVRVRFLFHEKERALKPRVTESFYKILFDFVHLFGVLVTKWLINLQVFFFPQIDLVCADTVSAQRKMKKIGAFFLFVLPSNQVE